MRNLKKFLALVLALALAMSMMLTASAADWKTSANVTLNKTDIYPDGESVLTEFIEAVDVLSGMGIFKGENGDFKPKEGIMRCEVVAVMYRICTGDVNDDKAALYAYDTTLFNDVPDGAWYSGYLGYCVNAGIIKGYNGDFLPTKQVTGYEMLIMLLRAMGYGKNDEFTGANYRINAAATAQSIHILDEINSTHYANQLSEFSPREVVAQMAFKAIRQPQVTYQLGFYNQYIGVPVTGTSVDPVPNQSLAEAIFDLHSLSGIIVGNQDTGENATLVSSSYRYSGASSFSGLVTGIGEFGHKVKVWYGKDGMYAWYDKAAKVETVEIDLDDSVPDYLDVTPNAGDHTLGAAAKAAGFKLDTYSGAVFNNFFGYSGWAVEEVNGTPMGWVDRNGDRWTGSNYYYDEDGTPTDTHFTDYFTSPNNKYLLISNSGTTLDLVIPLNIQSSQIMESSVTRGVPTVGVYVDDGSYDDNFNNYPTDPWDGNVKFIERNSNVNWGNVSAGDQVTFPGTSESYTPVWGILAQAALTNKANVSTTKLNAYEIGIHINGTKPREISKAEVEGVKYGNTYPSTQVEDGYFLLYELDKQVGNVTFYNGDYVMFADGTTLNRSKYYDTVVELYAGSENAMPVRAIPQSVALDSNKNYVESYNAASYTFYLDWEGNYVGAERNHDGTFFYGTYLDYNQFLSSGTFEYYLTGVDQNGNVDTRLVTHYVDWNATQGDRKNVEINGTDALKVPFRDSWSLNSNGANNLNYSAGYKGFTYNDNGDTKLLDPNTSAAVINQTDYAYNMERQGIIRGLDASGSGIDDFGNDSNNGTLIENITIDSTVMALGMVETDSGSKLWLTDDTKIILVDGYGEDTVTKTMVCNGLSDMMKQLGYSKATINLNYNDVDGDGNYTGRWGKAHDGTPYAAMTYYTKESFSFDQSGATDEYITWIIMPKIAVTGNKSSNTEETLYYIGDPSYKLISANSGSDAVYLYTLYNGNTGEETPIWLTNGPEDLEHDSFILIAKNGKTVPNYNNAPSYELVKSYPDNGTYADATAGDKASGLIGGNWGNSTVTFTSVGNFGGKLTGTFNWIGSSDSWPVNVADATVVNLAENVWPNVYDPTTLCGAGSLAATTSSSGASVRNLYVSAVMSDSVNAKVIFICWDQSGT